MIYQGLQPLTKEEADVEKYGIKFRETHYYVAEYKEPGILNPHIRHADVIIVRGDETACNRVMRNIPNLDNITECAYEDDAQIAADAFNAYVRDIGVYGECRRKEIRTEYLDNGISLHLEITTDDDDKIYGSVLTVYWGEGADEVTLFTVDEVSGESDIDDDTYNLMQQLPDDVWNSIVCIVENFVVTFDMYEDPIFEIREAA